jgi:hypothetical protein
MAIMMTVPRSIGLTEACCCRLRTDGRQSRSDPASHDGITLAYLPKSEASSLFSP